MVINLLSNALKFTPKGGDILIRSKYLRDPSEIILEDYSNNHQVKMESIIQQMQQAKYGLIQVQVQDSGIGIKPENQERLFKLFGFLDATKELNTKGIGLGLHISKQIV